MSDEQIKEKDEYTVHLAAFEGPMELLLHLIEKNKIDIYDIPIAELTQQYLDSLAAMRQMNMEVTSSFLVMAAMLLQIKSRMLLPELPKEEGEEEEDPRQELVNRIVEYQRFQALSLALAAAAERQEVFVAREPMTIPVRHLPPASLPLDRLLAAFRTAMREEEERPAPKRELRIVPEAFHIGDKMREIRRRLKENPDGLEFREMYGRRSRQEIITAFLALLELLRLHEIDVRQAGLFAPVRIYRAEPGSSESDGEESVFDTSTDVSDVDDKGGEGHN